MKNQKDYRPKGHERPGGPMGAGMMPVEKAKDFKGTLKRLIHFLSPYKFKIFAVFFMAILSTGFSIAAPKIMANITNSIFGTIMARFGGAANAPFDYTYIARIIFILIAVYLVSSLFNWGQGFIMAGVAQKTAYDLRRESDLKLSRLPLSYFDQTSRGDILSRITNDMDNISNTLQQSLTQIITAIVTIIGVLVMMLTISPLLTGISVVMIVISGAATMVIAKNSQKFFKEQWASTGRLNGHVEEIYTGHREVTLFNRQKAAMEVFEDENKNLYKSSFKAQFVSGIIMPSIHFINDINYVLICVVGGMRIISGKITLGDVTAFVAYSKQISQPITQTASILNTLQSTIASAERVFQLLDETEQEPDTNKPVVMENTKGLVEFKNVFFSYSEEKPLIEDLSLTARPGKTIAIVGPTGAGKTTLVNLIMRFYEIGAGQICIDGVDIRNMTRENLRSQIGMVLQDTWLFSGSIYDNIAYGVEGDVSEAAVLSAAKDAYVDHFVKTLSEGYGTVLNDDASNISQGQRQLITIARAFLSDPSILILDEATSSVDTRTEVLIQKAMERLMQGRTSFVIAHRLSTIRDADLILVMRDGAIVEQGNHEELLAAHGFYYELYNSQFSDSQSA